MSQPQPPAPGLLTISLLYREPERLESIRSRLTSEFGPVAAELAPFRFDFTDYYAAELGTPLWRAILSFEAPLAREQLAAVKLRTNRLEEAWSEAGHRSVNLDPGLITRENFLLATGKNSPHRVYLAEGVYADLTLIYQQGAFQILPWTYADYRVAPVREWLQLERQRLLTLLAGSGA